VLFHQSHDEIDWTIEMKRTILNLVALIAFLAMSLQTDVVRADVSSAFLLTVEWLVDNSEQIVILDYKNLRGEEKKPTVVRVLKGDEDLTVWPLKGDGDNDGPPSDGDRRLAFIGPDGKLLQEVRLDRRYGDGYSAGAVAMDLRLYDVWYGTTQFGELLLSKDSLIAAIKSRLEAKPRTPMERDKGNEKKDECISGPSGFVLDGHNVLCLLVVPMTVEDKELRIEYARSHMEEEAQPTK
jgi:hypothetical protein